MSTTGVISVRLYVDRESDARVAVSIVNKTITANDLLRKIFV